MTDMGKYDTHGGYFSPQGYLRINEGGSHDENPNGGVQLGTDGQGIPNMLEENEPVYNDFVYSDNIRADAELLKKHNIPVKFAGKLFSEIADCFVDEASERPNDPVSNNGLNAMLVRLADAQEEQKQIQEQKELEEEIANLSPEEQAELERMLAGQETQPAAEQQMSPEEAMAMQQGVPQEGVPQEMTPEEVAMMQQQYAQPQVMAEGGFIRRFDTGTPGTVVADDGTPETVVSQDGHLPEGTSIPFDVNPETGDVTGGVLMRVNPETGELIDTIEPSRVVAFPGKTQAWVDAEVGPEGRAFKQKIKDGRREFAETAYGIIDDASLPLYFVPGIGEALAVKDAIHGAATGDYNEMMWSIPFFGAGKYARAGKKVANYKKKVAKAEAAAKQLERAKRRSNTAQGLFDEVKKKITDLSVKMADMTDPSEIKKAEQEMKALYEEYNKARSTVHAVAAEVVPAAINNGYRQSALWLARDPNKPVSKGRKIFNAAKAIGIGGGLVYGGSKLFGDIADNNNSSVSYGRISYDPFADDGNGYAHGGLIRRFDTGSPDGEIAVAAKPGANEKINGIASRYAGPMMNGLIGLYNTFQKPDKYTLPSYTPVMPYGRLALSNPIYRPVDENTTLNEILANEAGARRALLNSGAGSSTPQTLLAMNYGTAHKLGAARRLERQINNELYNNVVQQRNANAQTLGTFDNSLALQRAGILNSRQLLDMNNFLKLQQLNYASESGKYAAISSSLTDLAKGLSDIGNETYSRNSANSVNSYSQDESGNNEYDPKKKKTDGTATKRNGGFLRRYKGR